MYSIKTNKLTVIVLTVEHVKVNCYLSIIIIIIWLIGN